MISSFLLSLATAETFNPVTSIRNRYNNYQAAKKARKDAQNTLNAEAIRDLQKQIKIRKQMIEEYEQQKENAKITNNKDLENSWSRKIALLEHQIKRMEKEIKNSL